MAFTASAVFIDEVLLKTTVKIDIKKSCYDTHYYYFVTRLSLDLYFISLIFLVRYDRMM